METTPPVKEGETYKLKIEAIGNQGDGIAKIEGYNIIVKGSKEIGQELNIRIFKVLPKFAFAEII